jgi:hypothetical protein
MQQLKSEGKELKIVDVRAESSLCYKCLYKNGTNILKQVEYALYMGTKFRGKCHWCGNMSHKASAYKAKLAGKPKIEFDSPTNQLDMVNGASGTKTKKICNYCKIKGHKESECQKKKVIQKYEKREGDKRNRLSGYRYGKDKSTIWPVYWLYLLGT